MLITFHNIHGGPGGEDKCLKVLWKGYVKATVLTQSAKQQQQQQA